MVRPATVIVIPARLHSTRLPEKLLLNRTGKTVLQHTFEAAQQARLADHVVVATDHEKIADVVRRFGGDVRMTDPEAASGTDRVAQVAQANDDWDVVVNVQGDEPEVDPDVIDVLIETLKGSLSCEMATLAAPMTDPRLIASPDCVKVVFDRDGYALYFSRSPIPYRRDPQAVPARSAPIHHQHLGLYAYRRPFLLQLAQTPPSPLECVERLEQLRVLEAGHRIRVAVVAHAAAGIDTPTDYEAFVARYRGRPQAA